MMQSTYRHFKYILSENPSVSLMGIDLRYIAHQAGSLPLGYHHGTQSLIHALASIQTECIAEYPHFNYNFKIVDFSHG